MSNLYDIHTTSRGENPDDLYAMVEALRPVYLKSKSRIDGEDEEWEKRKEFLLGKIMGLIKGFQPDDSSTKAVLIVGQTQALAAELDQPRLNVLQFETLQKQYNDSTAQ